MDGQINSTNPAGSPMRLDDAITFFLSEWPSEGATQDTVRSYGAQLKWLCGFAAKRGKVQLADLTPELLRAAMAAKQAGSHSLIYKGGEATCKTLVCATRAMLRWLKVQGVTAPDLSMVKAPHLPERVQPRLRQEEFQALETAILQRLVQNDRRAPRLATARDLALVYLLADTGLRASEVCALRLDSIDFHSGSVHVVQGKGKKDRELSIVDSEEQAGGITLRLLADWIEMRQCVRGAARNNSLWVSMKGMPLTRESLRRILLKMCHEAGIDGNRPPHAFRRAQFTENFMASPTSVRVLASRMGWSPKSHHMIDTYTRGVEIELARTTPVPSLSARWHGGTPPASPRRIPAPAKRTADPAIAKLQADLARISAQLKTLGGVA